MISTGQTLNDIRNKLAEEDGNILNNSNNVFPQNISPSSFLTMGLELEEQQRDREREL